MAVSLHYDYGIVTLLVDDVPARNLTPSGTFVPCLTYCITKVYYTKYRQVQPRRVFGLFRRGSGNLTKHELW